MIGDFQQYKNIWGMERTELSQYVVQELFLITDLSVTEENIWNRIKVWNANGEGYK